MLRGEKSETSQGLDMLTVITSLSTDFSGSLIGKDSQEVKDSRQCYCEVVASLRANCIIQGVKSVCVCVLNLVDFYFGR